MSTTPLALQGDAPATPPAAPASPPAAPAAGGSDSGAPPAPPAGGAPATPPAGAPAAPAGEPTWRDRIVAAAGGDKSLHKGLEQYTDEAAWVKAQFALRQKLSAGELKAAPAPFPKEGTDADKLAWKQANGVPDKPEAYLEKIAPPAGVVFGDADKPALERLAGFAAKGNWSQDQYNTVLAAYHNELAAVTTARETADDQFHQQTEDALRTEWGPDFRRNFNAVHNMLAGAPAGIRERLMGGRTADGKLIGDDPQVLKWLAQTSVDLNPAATILPSGMSETSFKSRFDTLAAMVKDPSSDYYKGVNSAALRQEYLDLLDKQEKMQPRGRAA